MLNPRRTICLLVTLLILPAVGMAGQEPSLAELARKEKERRAQTQAKVRVLSNSDVAKFQKGTVTTGAYGEEPAAKTVPSTPSGSGTPDSTKGVTSENLLSPGTPANLKQPAAGQVKDEQYWRSRFKELNENIKAAENKSVLGQLQLNDLRNRFYRESDGFYRETILKDIDLKSQEITRLDQELKNTQKQLEDLKREARQNNVPPGWIR